MSLVADIPVSIDAAQKIISLQRGEIDRLKFDVEYLERQIRLLKHQKFAAKSEKMPPSDQPLIFDEAEGVVAATPAAEHAEVVTVAAHTKKKPKRKNLPRDLPRVRIVHDIPESAKICTEHGVALRKTGEEISEQLAVIPQQWRVEEHVRPKYECPCCAEKPSVIAPVPAHPIPKSFASPSLLAHIAVSKYADSLPLYRQQQIYDRAGIDLPRQTMAEWMIRCGSLVQPLLNLMRDELIASEVLHMDETPVQVLSEPGRTPQANSYMWVMATKGGARKIVLYDYAPTRAAKIPSTILDEFSGFLHCDAYDGYNDACKKERVTRLGCWAHVRRKFFEAMKSAPPGATETVAEEAMKFIKDLYQVERDLPETASAEEICAARQKSAVPILKLIRDWLDTRLQEVLPRGPTGTALSYLVSEWENLTVYTTDGRLKIDNNLAENAIRPFAIGRKNWLFCDSMRGAEASAALYSLIVTAKINRVEPFEFLTRVFTELPRAKTLADVERLLPWKPC